VARPKLTKWQNHTSVSSHPLMFPLASASTEPSRDEANPRQARTLNRLAAVFGRRRSRQPPHMPHHASAYASATSITPRAA